jgi:hypothetical protein
MTRPTLNRPTMTRPTLNRPTITRPTIMRPTNSNEKDTPPFYNSTSHRLDIVKFVRKFN